MDETHFGFHRRWTAATAFLGLLVAVGGCTSKSAGPAGPTGNDAAGPGSTDVASPPTQDTGGTANDDVGTPDLTQPPAGTGGATPGTGGTGSGGGTGGQTGDGPTTPPPDAPAAITDGGAPPFDAGIRYGCTATPNPADPTVGWTEFADPYPPPAGAMYPNLEYPYNLAPQDDCSTTVPITSKTSPCRFNRKGALYTHWIFQEDLTHFPPDAGVAATSPRSEIHWSEFKSSDARPERMWTGDVLLRGADTGTLPGGNCILQVHTNATGQGPVYLRINGGQLSQLGGPNYTTPRAGTWFNLKVAFNARTLKSTVWVNDCQVGTWDGSSFVTGALPGGDTFYFKNGSYGCSTGECIVQFANVRFFQR